MGKASRLKKQRCEHAAPLIVQQKLMAPRRLEQIDSASDSNPVAALRTLLEGRGWIEETPDWVLAQMWFERPTSLIGASPETRAAGPDGIEPTCLSVSALSTDEQGFLQDFEIHVEMAGRHGPGACADHVAPADRRFPLTDEGLADLAKELDDIEEHKANFPDMLACADGPGLCV